MTLWKEFKEFIPENIIEAFKRYYGTEKYYLFKKKQTKAVREKLEILEKDPLYEKIRKK